MFKQQIIFDMPGCDAYIGKGRKKEKKLIIKNHFHSELEFLYIISGGVRFYIDGKAFDAKEGDVFFVNSNIPHSTENLCESTEDLLLQFSSHSYGDSPISYLFGYMKKDEGGFYHFKKGEEATDELKELMFKIYEEKNIKERAYDYYINAYLQCVEALLHRAKLLPDAIGFLKHKKYERLLPAFEYIDKNYHEKISLSDLSKVMHLNESYLCRLFKEITGNGLSDYINYVRVYKSIQLFNTDKNLTEIADECGFLSLAYFNRVFKKAKGYTPSEFRRLGISNEVM